MLLPHLRSVGSASTSSLWDYVGMAALMLGYYALAHTEQLGLWWNRCRQQWYPRRSVCFVGHMGIEYTSFCAFRTDKRFNLAMRAMMHVLSEHTVQVRKLVHSEVEARFRAIRKHRYRDQIFHGGNNKKETMSDTILVDDYLIPPHVTCLVDAARDMSVTMEYVTLCHDAGKEYRYLKKVVLTVSSSRKTVEEIKQYVEEKVQDYIQLIRKERDNQLFVYDYLSTDEDGQDHNDEEHSSLRFFESPFYTTRSFHNLFFENKESVLQKIHFFRDRLDWYEAHGVPHTLGIGLHGPPGTGKTSFIKALAKYLNRNIVTISLKLIQHKQQLRACLHETKYSDLNCGQPIGFDKKIIVFEDIDCCSSIVKKRGSDQSFALVSSDGLDDSLDKRVGGGGGVSKELLSKKKSSASALTLDDLLNVLDGVCETPGRIVVMTSNHYQELDPALVRPGRIDLCLEFGYVSRALLSDIYHHYYQVHPAHKEAWEEGAASFPEHFYTPAEVTNVFLRHPQDPRLFLERLAQSQHV